MTKILFLADINSTHTRKWVLAVAKEGFKIGIFSLNKANIDWFKNVPNIEYLSDSIAVDSRTIKDSGKLSYFKAVPALKRAIKAFKPDVIHAHYATSYGMLGALSGFHPFIISVWGSDIYEFPKKSWLHKYLLKRNLRKADRILSTSRSMALETAKYTKANIDVTPFGIDTNLFKPQKVKSIFAENDIVIGTIKALEPVYGIKYLLEAFDIVHKKRTDISLKLLIVGGGSQEAELKQLCKIYSLGNDVKFTGWIGYEEIPIYHNMLDIYVALSESESFGVSVLEASACAKPVVVSNVSGFAEIVENGVTGIIVPVKNARVAASAIEKLINDKEYARQMGENGRKKVEGFYNWTSNINDIVNIYNSVLK